MTNKWGAQPLDGFQRNNTIYKIELKFMTVSSFVIAYLSMPWKWAGQKYVIVGSMSLFEKILHGLGIRRVILSHYPDGQTFRQLFLVKNQTTIHQLFWKI